MPTDGHKITREDLERTLEIHKQTVELQILISQNQEKLVERQDLFREEMKEFKERLEKLEEHFSNGFKAEIKEHIEEHLNNITANYLSKVLEKMDVMERRSWQQTWLWAGIAFFTLTTAISIIIELLT